MGTPVWFLVFKCMHARVQDRVTCVIEETRASRPFTPRLHENISLMGTLDQTTRLKRISEVSFVCVHVCMYVCTYVCMYELHMKLKLISQLSFVCLHICMYVCTYVCMYVLHMKLTLI
jgi:hypothetical protein